MILGVHVSKTSLVSDDKKTRELHDAIKFDLDLLKLNACQLFIMGPRIPTPVKIDEEKIIEVTKEIDVTVHGCYTSVGVWKVFDINIKDAKSKQILKTLEKELEIARSVSAWGYVIHIAKMLPEDIAHTMRILKPIVEKSKVKLLLEMVASKSDPEKTYETPEKLDNLITLIDKECRQDKNADWYGICIDTAHIWCAGQKINTYDEMSDWLNRMTFKHRIELFHINGCSSARGSGKDHHELPFSATDKIWHGIEPKKSGLAAVIDFAVKRKIPLILEVKRGSEKEIKRSLNTIKTLGGIVA